MLYFFSAEIKACLIASIFPLLSLDKILGLFTKSLTPNFLQIFKKFSESLETKIFEKIFVFFCSYK